MYSSIVWDYAQVSDPTLSYLIGRTDRMVQAQLGDALADAGLTLAELTALSVLAERPGLSNARLARRSLVSPQAMHKVMRSLEEQEFVSRHAAPGGGRSLEAFITEAGTAKLQEMRPLLELAEDRALAALKPSDRTELLRLLKLASSLG